MSVITKAGAIGLSSFLAGVASVTLAYWFIAFLAFAHLHLRFSPPTGQTWRSFVFGLTDPYLAAIVITWIGAASLAGAIGYGASRRARREGAGRVADSAARFALAGLTGVTVDMMVPA